MKAQQRHICDWLRNIGAQAVRIEPALALGHPKLCFSYAGKDYQRPIASSPSDPNAWKQTIRELKNMLGLQRRKPRKHVGEKRPGRSPSPMLPDFAQPSRFIATAGQAALNTPFADLAKILGDESPP